jgi:N-acetylmuramoyl-L-alanine amidase
MEKKISLKPEEIEYLIIHHSATPRDSTTFTAVRNQHINERGFWDIGYHYFIDGKGTLYNGRPENYVGAHAASPGLSMNFKSLGICLAGNFEIELPSPNQIQTLINLLYSLMAKYNIPKSNILGHKEVKGTNTLCPGQNLLKWLVDWRSSNEQSEKEKIKQKLFKIRQDIDDLLKEIG